MTWETLFILSREGEREREREVERGRGGGVKGEESGREGHYGLDSV